MNSILKNKNIFLIFLHLRYFYWIQVIWRARACPRITRILRIIFHYSCV